MISTRHAAVCCLSLLFLAVLLGCAIEIEGDIVDSVTWTRGKTYEIGWMVGVRADLTIEPGVTVQFTEPSAGLYVEPGGSITAVGSENERILFTSAMVREPGAWYGVSCWDGSGPITLEYCDFLYGGNNDIYSCAVGGYLAAGSMIRNCTFAHSLTWGLDAAYGSDELPGEVVITENVFHSNLGGPVRISGRCVLDATNTFHEPGELADYTCNWVQVIGSITGTTVFDITEVPYCLTGNGISGNLTIDPGVVLKVVEGVYHTVADGGTLTANGTDLRPVVFTSYRDDLEMGDSNGDGSSAGSPGDWQKILTYAGSSMILTNCSLRFGGSGDAYAVDGEGQLVIDQCSIYENLSGGVNAAGAGASTTITDSIFIGNGTTSSGPYDINRDGNANVTVSGNEAESINL